MNNSYQNPNGQQGNEQQQNQQQNYQQPPHPQKQDDGRGLSTASLVLGIVSATASLLLSASSIACLVAGIVGIVLGIKGREKSISFYGKASGMATAGLVLSIIGTAVCALVFLSCLACMICVGGALAEIGKTAYNMSSDVSHFYY